jgi:hypothetical protein
LAHPKGVLKLEQFLIALAREDAAANTQNQAFDSIVFCCGWLREKQLKISEQKAAAD